MPCRCQQPAFSPGEWAASRFGLITKIHALVDAEGRPIHLLLTAGQAGDALAGCELLARLAPGGILFADKAYDTDAIRAETTERGGLRRK